MQRGGKMYPEKQIIAKVVSSTCPKCNSKVSKVVFSDKSIEHKCGCGYNFLNPEYKNIKAPAKDSKKKVSKKKLRK